MGTEAAPGSWWKSLQTAQGAELAQQGGCCRRGEGLRETRPGPGCHSRVSGLLRVAVRGPLLADARQREEEGPRAKLAGVPWAPG